MIVNGFICPYCERFMDAFSLCKEGSVAHILFIFGDGLQLELLTSTKLLSFILNDLRLMPLILGDPPYF